MENIVKFYEYIKIKYKKYGIKIDYLFIILLVAIVHYYLRWILVF